MASASPSASSHRGNNGLYGGQLPPLVTFGLSLATCALLDRSFHSPARPAPPSAAAAACLVWGLFTRAVGALYLVSFASLRPQIVAIAGARGLFPAAAHLARVRKDIAPPRRYVHFPAALFCCSATDATLRGACALGMLAGAAVVLGLPCSRWLLLGCWAIFTLLSSALPLLQYPWDCLLMETGATCALLLPPLAPVWEGRLGLEPSVPPSAAAVWTVRLLLVRVMLGMGKFKFSRGWRHDDNQLYIKWFLSWQPLPTPLAYWAHHAVPDWVFVLLMRGMYFVEVAMPACYLSTTYWLRVCAAIFTACLQLGIQLSGNYGTFNLLTCALALPLVAPACEASRRGASAAELLAAAVLNLLGLVHFPHNSYTTNVWPFAAGSREIAALPAFARRPVAAALAVARAVAPLHLAHGYGVFTPLAPRNCTWQRRVIQLRVSFDGGETCPLELHQKHNATSTCRQSLGFFAPHQPRLDHHLYYEAMEVALQETTLLSPYFAAGAPLIARLARRLIERQPDVLQLLDAQSAAALAAAPAAPTHILVHRLWVRFATPAERQASAGLVWVRCDPPPGDDGDFVDVFEAPHVRHPPESTAPKITLCGAVEGGPMHLPKLSELRIQGFWAHWPARAARR
ncbi:hypothetical protein AB1Y20_006220 [Prymnesium parvum]|uniref:Lipase maturation factor 1/2 N-terminal domain-containing protein n=1 Tax=Prymnesium parvum TaxID=97485 RepID=A0AB34J3Z0_PRYPA